MELPLRPMEGSVTWRLQLRSIHVDVQKSGMIAGLAGIAEETWHELLDGNHRFCDGRMTQYRVRSQREALVTGQRPKAIIIGCSDSRVPPELIFDQSLGDLFVVRAAGNVVDAIALGSVEYAVEHLGTRLVIVLGHDRCGAVQAACSGGATGSPNLDAIIAELKPSVRECSKNSGAALIRDVVEKNAVRTSNALTYRSVLLRKAFNDGDLQVIAARYDLLTGEVVRVEPSDGHTSRLVSQVEVHSA
jgi:carbonic anhydrase